MINRIKIKNFRSLDVDVKLEPVTVLVGRSGTGKSNFVDAIRFLRDRLLRPDEKIKADKIKPILSDKDSLLEYEISFDVSQLAGSFTYLVKFNFNDHRLDIGLNNIYTQEEKLSFNDETLFYFDGKKCIVQPPIPQNNTHVRSLALAEINGIQKISIAHIALSEGIGCYDFPGNVCCPSVSQNDKKENTASNDIHSGLLDGGENINTIFGKIWHDLTRLESWNRINDSMRFVNDSIQVIDQKLERSGEIIVTHRFGDRSFFLDLSRESEGCRRFFAHMLAFHQTPPKQTMIFEEPERGLYPAAFAVLADEMKICHQAGQGQVILTTHSPDLLNSFEPESLRVVIMENGITRIGSIAPDQMQSVKDSLMTTGELLTVDDARIDTPHTSQVNLEGQTA
ncbi:MAG: ATP-binding protein [Planctomycetaceae bacterium]|jgi:predicted ATP-dependent endonuclease of OLD family|nr:ATP-binding protein [Planctomycetaceae bacterium]